MQIEQSNQPLRDHPRRLRATWGSASSCLSATTRAGASTSPASRPGTHRVALPLGPQTLHGTEGRGLVQSRGSQIIEIRRGNVIHTSPGEWHGAAPNRCTAHIAMWEVDELGNSASCGEHVSDDEYHGQIPTAREEEA